MIPTDFGRDSALTQLAESLDLSPELVARRLHILGLGADERARLRALTPLVKANAPRFLDGFYDRLTRCPATRAWLTSADLVARLKPLQSEYLVELFEGDYDWLHALRCLRIGVVHHRVRLTPQWFVASYGHFLCEHIPLLMSASASVGEAIERLITLVKSALFDASLVLDGYAMSAENAVRAHRVTMNTAERSSTATGASMVAPSSTPSVSRTRVATDEASERAAFLGIDDAVVAELRALSALAEPTLPDVLTEFYGLLSSWEETGHLVAPPVVERLKRQVGSYWVELFRSDFDRPYAASRTLVGIVHERVGLSSPLYVIGLAKQVESLLRRAVSAARSPALAADALLRAVFFDVSFVLQAYVQARAEAVLRTDGFASELLAGLTAGVAIVDARLRVESANPALMHLFGLDAGLVRYVHIGEVIPIPAAVELAQRAWETSHQRVSAVVEREGRAFRATALRLSASGSSKESVALVLDEITDIVRVQSEVQRAERSYAHVVDALRALMWECDDATFTLSLVSRSSLEVTGYRDVALLGRAHGFTTLIPEPDRAAFVARCRALAIGAKAEVRHRVTKADGATAWVRSEVARYTGHDGHGVLCGVTVDVTAAHLEEQRRLEAIGRLAGGIAHEYNNRLTVILTSLALLTDADSGVPEDALVREARLSAERCASVTRQILSVAQRQVLRPRPVALNDLLGAVRHTLARSLGDDVQLELRLAPDLWRCNVDEKELSAAIENLLANARDAMPGGGRLTITTRNVPANDHTAGEAAGQDLVEVSVEDTGVGMDESVKRRAFEPFFTTRPAATGLGLSIVRGFVAQSGGLVSLASEAGGGTVVKLLFPRLAERVAVVSLSVEDERPFVLAVDDEQPLRFVIQRLLQRLGYASAVVATVGEALDVLRARRVDVLVTDVVLGGGESGALLAPAARAIVPSLPVIYISGFTREELDLASLGERDQFISKPFGVSEFGGALRSALGAARVEKRRGA